MHTNGAEPGTTTGQRPGDLGDGSVHLWSASLIQPAAVVTRLRHLLSGDEQQRAGRLRFEQDRRRFVVRRGILRDILSRYLEMPAEDLVFRYGPEGKPYLRTPSSRALHFNVSSSGDLAVFAVTGASEIGIDLEHVRTLPEADHIMALSFTPIEYKSFHRLPAHQRPLAFFHGWTGKEAFLKATGSGLSRELNAFEVALSPDEPARLLTIEGDSERAREWQLRRFVPGAGYVSTVALRSAGPVTLLHQNWSCRTVSSFDRSRSHGAGRPTAEWTAC